MTAPDQRIAYCIFLTKEQYAILEHALDLYSRVLMGQFMPILELFRLGPQKPQPPLGVGELSALSRADKLLNEVKLLLTAQTPNESFGIRHNKVPDEARSAHDIYAAMKHMALNVSDAQSGYSVYSAIPNPVGWNPLPPVIPVEVQVEEDTLWGSVPLLWKRPKIKSAHGQSLPERQYVTRSGPELSVETFKSRYNGPVKEAINAEEEDSGDHPFK